MPACPPLGLLEYIWLMIMVRMIKIMLMMAVMMMIMVLIMMMPIIIMIVAMMTRIAMAGYKAVGEFPKGNSVCSVCWLS